MTPFRYLGIVGIYERLKAAHTKYVVSAEKGLEFVCGMPRTYVEDDEIDLGKFCDHEGDVGPATTKPVVWEQWGGIIERGNPATIVLQKLQPMRTVWRALGPGALRKRDWARM